MIQRVSQASVAIRGKPVAQIKQGLLVLLGVSRDDTRQEADFLADKIAKLRIFGDSAGKMNRSVTDVGGSVLVVSQFTLYSDTHKGNRPSLMKAAEPHLAQDLYNRFVQRLRDRNLPVQTGEFGAMMQVHLINDGPVTLILET